MTTPGEAKYPTAHDWLDDAVKGGRVSVDDLLSLIHSNIGDDEIQDYFESTMSDDGYFDTDEDDEELPDPKPGEPITLLDGTSFVHIADVTNDIGGGQWLVDDETGEEWVIRHDPAEDTQEHRAWRAVR